MNLIWRQNFMNLCSSALMNVFSKIYPIKYSFEGFKQTIFLSKTRYECSFPSFSFPL